MQTKQQITNYLVQKYHPVAILLHGSRARGTNRPNSDWDLYVLVDREVTGATPELWNGEQLDVRVVRVPVAKEDFLDTFLGTLQTTKVLYEVDGAAQPILALAKETYASPYELSPDRYAKRKRYLQRCILRLEGYVDQPELFFYYLACFYEELFHNWYDVRARWSQPLQIAWPQIQKEDPEYAALLTVLVSAASASERLDAAKQINQRLFPE